MRGGSLRAGTSAQSLAVNRHMPGGRRFAGDPIAKGAFQRGRIQLLEQFAPDRRGGNPPAGDTDGLKGFPAQPAPPAHDAQLAAPAGQRGRGRDEQNTVDRLAAAFRAPVVRDRSHDIPTAVRVRCRRIYPRLPKGKLPRGSESPASDGASGQLETGARTVSPCRSSLCVATRPVRCPVWPSMS